MGELEIACAEETDRLVETALREDLGEGDVTTQALIPSEKVVGAAIVAKGWGVMAGMPVADRVFRRLDPEVRVSRYKDEGEEFQEEELLASLHGKAAALLSAERVALNFLQRLCGIASLTRLYVKKLRGTRAVVLDTRKTTPGLRCLEKYAVRVGGGENHRFRLDEMVLIKDNHLAMVDGVGEAVRRARQRCGSLRLEVEVSSLEELADALVAAPDRVMLDNMAPAEMTRAVAMIQERAPGVEIEASGAITLASVRQVAAVGVDFVSIGALTHSAPACDMGLEVTLGV